MCSFPIEAISFDDNCKARGCVPRLATGLPRTARTSATAGTDGLANQSHGTRRLLRTSEARQRSGRPAIGPREYHVSDPRLIVDLAAGRMILPHLLSSGHTQSIYSAIAKVPDARAAPADADRATSFKPGKIPAAFVWGSMLKSCADTAILTMPRACDRLAQARNLAWLSSQPKRAATRAP